MDQSLYGNHGTLTNMDPATDWVVSGGRGALDFDGSNDRVVFSASSAFSLGKLWTAAAWVSTTGSGTFRTILSAFKTSTSNRNFFLGVNTANCARCYITIPGFVGVEGTVTVTGRFAHVCATYDGNIIRLYVDGKPDGTVSTTGTPTADSGDFAIGSITTAGAEHFSGAMDDVLLCNRPLTVQEIQIISRRRGIAYELDRRSTFKNTVAAFNRRRRVLMGAA
jgi:hypothetical protein